MSLAFGNWNNQQAVLTEIRRLYKYRPDPVIVGARSDRGDRAFTNFNFQGKDVQRAFGATEFNVRLEWLQRDAQGHDQFNVIYYGKSAAGDNFPDWNVGTITDTGP